MSNEIRRRAIAYHTAKQRALATVDPDDGLFWICVAATSAWRNPFGQWHDCELDQTLARIATTLGATSPSMRPSAASIVHMTSTIGEGGGHVEALQLWCENVGGSVICSQWEDVTDIVAPELLRLKNNSYLCPPKLSPASKVLWIFEVLTGLKPEKILLHINPNDVISLAAAVKYRDVSGAKLILYDHVDSFFWLGANLVDLVVEIRPVGGVIARDLRHVPESKLAYVPLTSRSRNSATLSREQLGLPVEGTVSLTVAAYYKTRSDGYWNYAQTINRILDRNPKHHHMIVGHGNPADQELIRNPLQREQVHFLGRRNDIDAVLRVSDFVIESFPLMGGLFRFDAMREGVPLVAIAHPQWREVFDMGAFPIDYPLTAQSNEDVIKLVQVLIDDPNFRAALGKALHKHYEQHFSTNVIAEAMKQALNGRIMNLPEMPLPTELDWFALMLNPARSHLQDEINWVSNSLHHTPKLGFLDRIKYFRGYVGAAISARIKQAQGS